MTDALLKSMVEAAMTDGRITAEERNEMLNAGATEEQIDNYTFDFIKGNR
jgi:hypothetical protein